jgi:hypothetical protein
LVTLNGCSATSSIVKVSIVLPNELPYTSLDFNIYPYPSSDVINLKLNEYLKQPVTLHLSNSTRANVKDWLIKESGINSLNINGLASGVYVIHGEINDKKVNVKIVKGE